MFHPVSLNAWTITLILVSTLLAGLYVWYSPRLSPCYRRAYGIALFAWILQDGAYIFTTGTTYSIVDRVGRIIMFSSVFFAAYYRNRDE